MGAPKQKWTSEEEAALKTGVCKHGAGKWQTILRDPEFSHVLRSRSNVDLKDKWRNINVTASGLGSREKARLALKRNPQAPKHDKKASSLNHAVQSNDKATEIKPSAISTEVVQVDSKRFLSRLENVILEALTTLKEPKGSEKDAITKYIEERYWAPPNLSKVLSSKLKSMLANEKLVKVKHRYRIPSILPSAARKNPVSDGKHKEVPRAEKRETRTFSRHQVDAELEKMRSLSAREAAAAAARAVAEAEAAIAEAEAAAREAEAAEAEAEAAQVFAEAAMKVLKCQTQRVATC